MKMRIVLLLTVVALMVMMLAMSVAPALAGKGGSLGSQLVPLAASARKAYRAILRLPVPLVRANLDMPTLTAVTVRDRATQGGPGHLRSGPSPCPYSLKCVE